MILLYGADDLMIIYCRLLKFHIFSKAAQKSCPYKEIENQTNLLEKRNFTVLRDSKENLNIQANHGEPSIRILRRWSPT